MKRNDLFAYWEPLVREWQASGLSARAWCMQRNISSSSFNIWKNKILGNANESALTTQSFVELSPVKSLSSSASGVELFCNNVSIRVSKNFDDSVLESCLRLLRRL
jgi:hypothetical protein